MSLKSEIKKLEKDLPLEERPDMASAVHWTPSTNFPVHRWYRYREGFSPDLFRFFPKSNRRLDPFCGCGTTLLDSKQTGVESWGVDLNPLATFVAKVKTRGYSTKDKEQFDRLSKQILCLSKKARCAPKPDYALLDKVFLQESMDRLLRMKYIIDRVHDKKLRELLLLCWLSILERSSNAFKEGNGLKYRNKKRQPGTYLTLPDRVWIPRYFGASVSDFIRTLWIKQCRMVSEDLTAMKRCRNLTPRIRTGSCFDPKVLDFGTKFDLAIFSPPYANRFDYFEAFKIELWMGRFITSKNEMGTLRSKSMRNNLAAKRFKSEGEWSPIQPFLDYMDDSESSVRMGIKSALEGYFYDIRVLLRNLKRHLTNKAKVVIVVGNSAYAKSIIPTDALIATVSREEGYAAKSIYVARHLHVSSQQRHSLKHCADAMRESVLVLENRS